MRTGAGWKRRAKCIAMACGSLIGAAPTWGQTTASWLLPVNGTWTDATKWSTNPDFPNNNTPPGSTYQVNLSATGSVHTITNGSSVALNELSLSSPDVTLQLSAGTTSMSGQVLVNAGTLLLAGGSIQGADIVVADSADARWTGSTGTLAASSLDGKITVASGLMRVGGGFTMNDSTIELIGSSSIAFTGNQTISGTGTIIANGSVGSQSVSVTTITFDSGISLLTGTSGIKLGSKLTNNGLISSRTAGRGIAMALVAGSNGGTLINQGTIEVINGGSFAFLGSFSNTGTIILNGGDFYVERPGTTGPVTTSFGTVLGSGGNVSLVNVLLDNAGATLTAGQGLSLSLLRNSEIRGGTIIGAPGYAVTFEGSSLNGVRLGGELTGAYYDARDKPAIKGGLEFLPGGKLIVLGGLLECTGGGSISGQGEIVVQTGTLSLGSVPIGPDVAVRSGPMGFGSLSGQLLNYGLISAEGLNSHLTVAVGSTNLNYGTLRGTNGATLKVQGFMNDELNWNLGTVSATGGGAVDLGLMSIFHHTYALTGTWIVGPGSKIIYPGQIFTNDGTILLDGPDVAIEWGSGFQAILSMANHGYLAVSNGARPLSLSSNSGNISVGTKTAITMITAQASPPFQSLENSTTINLNGSMVVQYSPFRTPSGLDLVMDQVQSGYNGGLWDGLGINSSAAAQDPSLMIGVADNAELGLTTFAGINVLSYGNTVLLRLTYAGDTNLDGVTDLSDFDRFLDGYTPMETTAMWLTGDFNYNGIVDLADFELYLRGYYALGGSVEGITSAVMNSGLPQPDQDAMLGLIATVPEPVGFALFGLVLPWLLKRPRRQ